MSSNLKGLDLGCEVAFRLTEILKNLSHDRDGQYEYCFSNTTYSIILKSSIALFCKYIDKPEFLRISLQNPIEHIHHQTITLMGQAGVVAIAFVTHEGVGTIEFVPSEMQLLAGHFFVNF
jgi:hypothetical protein